jgi:mannose-6-phosphate isomerase-like protein (cupin superfamily)
MPKPSRSNVAPAAARAIGSGAPPIMPPALQSVIEAVQAQRALAPEEVDARQYLYRPGQIAPQPLGAAGSRVAFVDEGLPFATQVLRPGMLTVPARRVGEAARHAQEVVAFVIEGAGLLVLNDTELAVSEGDAVFVPRWCLHQWQNTGASDLVLLTVTDAGLTTRVPSRPAGARQTEKLEALVPRSEPAGPLEALDQANVAALETTIEANDATEAVGAGADSQALA